jgi:hypothetical protein
MHLHDVGSRQQIRHLHGADSGRQIHTAAIINTQKSCPAIFIMCIINTWTNRKQGEE